MRVIPLLLLLSVLTNLTGCGVQLEGSAANQRATLRAMETDTLNDFYANNPAGKKRIRAAAGYAVFDASGGKFLWGGLDHGNGVVVDNASHQRTYMKMFELQPGLGFGYTNFRLVFLFDNRSAMDEFVNSGWEFGGRGTAAAKNSVEGGSAEIGYNVAPGITVYQLTKEGALVGLSITGAKYWRNDDLN
jgi:lipid-binding SYLF domain-containing protein